MLEHFRLFPLALFPLLLNAQVWEGSPAVTISNGKLSATILIQGATVASVVLPGAKDPVNPLWNPVRFNRELGRPAAPTSAAGHFVCVDGFGPVSPEERAAGLANHGEAHTQEFTHALRKEGSLTQLTMKADLPILQEALTRTFLMAEGENVMYVHSVLENKLPFDRPVQWAEHATVGSPFLESGVTVFDLSAKPSRTRPYAQAVNPSTGSVRRLASGKDFTWPQAPGVDGSFIDMRETPSNPRFIDHTATKFDPTEEFAWTTAINPRSRLLIGYIFRPSEYTWLQTWGNYPSTGKMSRGMEFATQPYDMPRRDTTDFRWIPAKSKIESRFLMFYTEVPAGFSRVDSIRMESSKIVIEDLTARLQLTLAASLGLSAR